MKVGEKSDWLTRLEDAGHHSSCLPPAVQTLSYQPSTKGRHTIFWAINRTLATPWLHIESVWSTFQWLGQNPLCSSKIGYLKNWTNYLGFCGAGWNTSSNHSHLSTSVSLPSMQHWRRERRERCAFGISARSHPIGALHYLSYLI